MEHYDIVEDGRSWTPFTNKQQTSPRGILNKNCQYTSLPHYLSVATMADFAPPSVSTPSLFKVHHEVYITNVNPESSTAKGARGLESRVEW